MQATVLQENLSKGLALASRAVAVKAQIPVLGNILLKENNGTLEIGGTNLELSIRLVVTGKVDKGFEITVPARQLAEFVGGMPTGQINLSISEGKLIIKGERFKAELSGIAASEFPIVPKPSGLESFKLSKEEWIKQLHKVVFAAGMDEARPVLTGVYIEIGEDNKIMVATDGYRLSKMDFSVLEFNGQPLKVLVPARTIEELFKLCSETDVLQLGVWVTTEANQIIFKVGDIELVSRLIEGNFPDYRKIIPSMGGTKVWMDKESLIRAVKLASIFARSSSNVVKLKMGGESLYVSANSPQLGENEGEMEIRKEGDDLEMAFNFKYLLDFANHIPDELIVLESSGPLSPGVFTVEGDPAFLHIIMPVRVQG
jgi:DNA polymerase III subunit beta